MKYEYKITTINTTVKITDKEIEKQVNELGANGWELVCSHVIQPFHHVLIFKREVKN